MFNGEVLLVYLKIFCILKIFFQHSDHNYSRLDSVKQRLLKAIDEQEQNIESDLNQLDLCIQNKVLTSIFRIVLTRGKLL